MTLGVTAVTTMAGVAVSSESVRTEGTHQGENQAHAEADRVDGEYVHKREGIKTGFGYFISYNQNADFVAMLPLVVTAWSEQTK